MPKIAIVTPVAPRDLNHLRVSLESISAACYYTSDSRLMSTVFKEIIPYIVVDGEVEKDVQASVEAIVRQAFVHLPLNTIKISPVILFLKDRSGPGCARNAAIAEMEPDTICFFLDSDDIMYPWSITERLQLFLMYDENILAYGQNVIQFEHPEHGIMRNIRECPGSKNLLSMQKRENCLIPGLVATSAGVIQEAGGFEPHLICGEDGNLFRRILEAGVPPISKNVPMQMYRYREDSQSKMATNNPDEAQFNEQAFHLGTSWDKHGPMGQNLDPQATARGQAFKDAATNGSWGDMLEALAPGVAILDRVVITYGDAGDGDHTGEDPSDPD